MKMQKFSIQNKNLHNRKNRFFRNTFMNDTPLISIIILTYNRARYLYTKSL